MKDKIVFFILGAIVATGAYLLGFGNKQDSDVIHCRELHVEKGIFVGEAARRGFIGISVDDGEEGNASIALYQKNGSQAWVMVGRGGSTFSLDHRNDISQKKSEIHAMAGVNFGQVSIKVDDKEEEVTVIGDSR